MIENQIERQSSIKFIEVLVNENIRHIKRYNNTTEIKITKNIGLLYDAKNNLNMESLKHLHFTYVHSSQFAWTQRRI